MVDVKTEYPERYYARYDTKAAQPTVVTGWFDTWGMSDVSGLPNASEMIAVPRENFQDHATSGVGVQDGRLISYTAPAPIKDLAGYELTGWVASQASMASAMGETFTSDMKAYVKAVQAIADGTDTASTKLPDRPTGIMT
ncbi:hypothetical protein [Acetobacter tropicalis]|uniref:hypothetical protein n=1 Tax=Acetobacter tropicalis TaxID=104102 RepID=UPI0007775E11|nr:hypothetical protein [Acetobacter tropicalis]